MPWSELIWVKEWGARAREQDSQTWLISQGLSELSLVNHSYFGFHTQKCSRGLAVLRTKPGSLISRSPTSLLALGHSPWCSGLIPGRAQGTLGARDQILVSPMQGLTLCSALAPSIGMFRSKSELQFAPAHQDFSGQHRTN